VFSQKLGTGRVVGEQEDEGEEDDEGHEGDDDHEPLPLIDRMWVGGGTCRGVVCTKGDKTGDNRGDAVALERPADTFPHLRPGVEHGRDKHDSGCDATFSATKKDTEDSCVVNGIGVSSVKCEREKHEHKLA